MKRQTIVLIASLFALMGSSVALFSSIESRDFNLRGYENPLNTLDLPYRIPRFGVNADLRQYDPDELRRNLDMMRELGVVWIRQFVDWADVETIPDEFDWSVWDQILDALSDYPQLRMIPVLVNAPDWASNHDCIGCTFDWSVPDNPADFARFVGEFAARYGNEIHYYQIWDEPNLSSAWGGRNPNPAHYIALLRSAYDAAHGNDSDAHIIAAALAPTVESGPRNINEAIYLRGLYQLGLKAVSDSIAGKPYGFNSPPDDRRIRHDFLNFSRIITLREIMLEHDDSEKMLWASSWGWNSLPDDWGGDPSIWGTVNHEGQISYTDQAIRRVYDEWPWLGGLLIESWQPDAEPDDPIWGFALVDTMGEPTPLYNSVGNTISYFAGRATNGFYHANNPHAVYHGAWTVSEAGADIGWVQDSHLTFDFYGRGIGVITRQDNYVANLYATVNGVSAHRLPSDGNGNAYLALRSDTLTPRLKNILLADSLSLGEHRLQITADELIPDEPFQRWPIVGFAVSSGDLGRSYTGQITVAWFAFGVSLIAFAVSAIQFKWRPLHSRFARLWRPLNDVSRIFLSFTASTLLMLSLLATWHDGYPQFFKREPVQIVLSLLTAGLIYWHSFGLLFTLLLAGLLFFIIYNDLRIGLLLVAFWSPFFLFPVELYRFAFPTVEVMLMLTFTAYVFRLLTNWATHYRNGNQSSPRKFETMRVKLEIIDWLVIAWLILGLIALTYSERRAVALTDFRTIFLQPAIFYLILRYVQPDIVLLRRLIFALIAAALVVSTIGIYQMLAGTFIEAEAGARRLASVYGSPNNAALFLGRVLPFLIAIALVFQHRKKLLIAMLILMTLVGSALLLTQSAGAIFLGLPFALITVLVALFGRRSLRPITALFLLGLLATMIAVQMPRFERLLDLTSGTNFYRIRVWQSAEQMIGDHPITGIGLDQFLYEYRGRYILPDAWEEPDLSHPHNIVLDFWLRLGVAGVLYFMAAVFFISRLLADQIARFKLRTSWNLALSVGVAGGFVNLLAHGLVDNSVFVIDLAYVFMLFLGILATLNTHTDARTGRG